MKESVLYDDQFNLNSLNKFASLLTLGNGYLGIRSSHEENYAEQTRGMYIAGIYNRAYSDDTSELVNLPDIICMRLEIDGDLFTLNNGNILSYKRYLNLITGELTRKILWEKGPGERYKLIFKRFVSKEKMHLIISKLTITSLDKTVRIKLLTGIDAQQTNHGKQHLIEENQRVFDNRIIQATLRTTQTRDKIILTCGCTYPNYSKVSFSSQNRILETIIEKEVIPNQICTFNKFSSVYTSLDPVSTDMEIIGIKSINEAMIAGYSTLLEGSKLSWNRFWKKNRININSTDMFDQLALDFALYHIEIMTPSDDRFSIGAKGLTGEGYKGHVFWDTEIFLLPFHLHTDPRIARNLLHYRFTRLKEAKRKAVAYGYEGVLFPWESAITGMEETPKYAQINIRTGKRQPVASSLAEHHINADIAYAVDCYYKNTLDNDFMRKEGIFLLKETSRFWLSKAERLPDSENYVINQVIGPDEYKEFVNNNAYTNYMAYFNVKQTLYYMKKFNDSDKQLINQGKDFIKNVYLPQPNIDKIIPQDDSFLSKPEIDLTQYRSDSGSQNILKDFSRSEVINLQVLKQADVIMLFFLFPNLFSEDVIQKNLKYYERHTVHDSSLSKAIHSIVAMQSGDKDLAFRFFKEACLIDLGTEFHSSDEGIHAASTGAIWLIIVFGFFQYVLKSESISIAPTLPDSWSKIEFSITIKNRQIHFFMNKQQLVVTLKSGNEIPVEIYGIKYNLKDRIELKL